MHKATFDSFISLPFKALPMKSSAPTKNRWKRASLLHSLFLLFKETNQAIWLHDLGANFRNLLTREVFGNSEECDNRPREQGNSTCQSHFPTTLETRPPKKLSKWFCIERNINRVVRIITTHKNANPKKSYMVCKFICSKIVSPSDTTDIEPNTKQWKKLQRMTSINI